jgi:TP901 family phage tail tape measure protein
MADVNANIGVHIDTSAALVELKNLQRQLATFHSSVAKSSAASAAAQKNLQTNLLNSINATGKFSAQMGTIRTSTESFTHALETNKLSMREYFRFAGGSTKTFGRLFKQEFDTIGKVAQERVKTMQTQYIKMGRDASGAMQAMSIRPTTLNMNDYATKTALAAQKQALFNQLMKQGSTNLLNFGKNTQWAGRQLMVGFTIPLAYFGTMAAKTFMDLEAQAVKFRRVYGDMFTTTDETTKALSDIEKIAKEFTKYGVSAVKTMELASQAAAMGQMGADLTAQVVEANRLAVLGSVEQDQALATTISLTSAFGTAAEDLANKIDFLNAVENQTVVSIEDLTVAIPKAGPVVKQLGGDVEDLAFFLTAMKEGGINASEGANALKSGLAALINPTGKAADMLAEFGININQIVEGNQGNIRQTVIDFSRALDTLDPLNRARAIEQLFGKFQFSRLSTLFQNVTKDGTQAARVLDLAGSSMEQLAILSERELGVLEDATGVQFKAAVEELKFAIAPIGKTFLEAVTPIVKIVGDLLEKFNGLSDGTKKFLVVATTVVGVIGPVLLMTFGLLANGVANIIKLFLSLRTGFLKLGGNSKILAQQTDYLNSEQLEAASVAASLNQAHTRLTQSFTAETSAVKLLRQAYIDATVAAANFARANPGMMMPGRKGAVPKKFARGATYVPGRGNKDTVPSMLTPGEAVIPKDVAQDPRFQPIIDAMVNGNLQGFNEGATKVSIDGKEYNAKSAPGAKNIRSFLDSLIKNPDGTLTHIDPKTKEPVTFTKKRLLEVLDGRYARVAENKFTLSEIKEKLSIGGVKKGSGVSSSKGWVNTLTKKAGYPNMLAEKEAIEAELKKKGFNPSQDQRKNLFQTQASHLTEEVGPDGKKIFRAANIAPDAGYINNYMNTVKNKVGKSLLSMNNSDLAKALNLSENDVPKFRKELDGLVRGKHPTTAASANALRAVAQYQIATTPNSPGIYQAHAAVAGIDYRMKTNFYKGRLKTLAQLFPNDKRVVAERSATKSQVVDGQTGAAKPARVMTTSGAPSEKRTVGVGKNETILNKKSTSALRSGRMAFIPGLGRLRIAGAQEGIPTGQKTGSTTLGTVTQSIQLKEAQIRAAVEGTSLKEAKRRIAAEAKLTKAITESTKTQITAKDKLTQFSSKAGMGIGAMSALTIAASFAGGKVGEMAQTIMPFVFGLQGILMLLPKLANPWVAAIAAIAVFGGIILKMAKDIDNARKEGIALAQSMSMTSTKLKDLSVVAGTVSASEEASKRRKNILSGTIEPQRQFGQNALESDVGKQILADIETQSKSGKSIKEISQNLANNLAVAVAQGAVTTSQAKSISAALGEKLGSYEIPALVSGRLTSLLGPNGENLAKDPLKVTLDIQKDSMQRQSDSFKTAIEGAISESTAPNVLARVAGFGLIAAGIAATVVTGGVAAGAGIAAVGAGAMMLGEQDANKRKAVNVKLGAAAVELGIQEVAQNQGLVDSLNRQYDIKLKSAKTEKEIKAIEDQRKVAIDKLNQSNANALNLLVSQKDQLGEEAFTKGIKAAADVMYKEGPMAVFKDSAIEALNELEDSNFKTQLQIGLASGQVSPTVISKILSTAAENKGFETAFSFLVDKQGLADAALIAELLPSQGATDMTRTLMLSYINNNGEDFATDMESLAFLNQINSAYGITLDLKANGVEQIVTTTNALKQIEGLDPVLTKDVVAKLAEEKPGEWAQFYSQWKILSEGEDAVNKNLKVAFDIVSNDPNFKGFSDASWKKIAEIIAKGEPIDLTGGVTPPPPPGPKTPKARDTTFDDILTNLKRTRNATIDAQGGAKELIRILGGAKDLKAFKGIDQQLSKIGANSDFIDFVGGLEKAIQNKIIKVNKKGIVTLTELGKAAKKAYNEKQLGLFSAANAQVINESIKQRNAFIKLKAAGVETADAQEMLADSIFVTSLAAQKNPKEIRKMIAEYKNMQFQIQKTLENTNPEKAFEIQMNKAMEYYDFLEKEARAAAKPELTRINDLIDANEKLIQTQQREIEMQIDRPIDKLSQDLAIIDKAAQGINDKYDAQEKALDSISNINEEISQQEKGRLTLADALSQGDIAAAARAAQEMRAEAAQNAMQRSSGALQAAREAELAGLTVGGLTRAQIEEKIYELEQQRLPLVAALTALQDKSYNLQVDELEPLQEALDARIKNIDAARTAFDNQQLAIEKAGIEADKTNGKFKIGEGIVETVKRLWNDIRDKNITLTVNTVYTSSGAPNGAGLTDEEKAITDLTDTERGIFGFAKGGLVPKYFAKGGLSKGTDTVPAMLTPGEFVISKAAVDKFGPMLSAINDPSFKIPKSSSYSGASSGMNSVVDNSSAMYNYNIGITVPQSNANPNDIANAVIGQIKYIDAQRIRGQK